MTQSAQPFYSCTWDTRFLELPPGKVLLATHKSIPTRPTAEVDLKFITEINSLDLQVVENKNQPKMVTVVARYNGRLLELRSPKYNSSTQQTEESWRAWNHQHDPNQPPRFQSEEEALCWMTLVASDVGCPGQARADFPIAIKSPLWTALWDEMQRLQAVASVMLT